MTGTLGENGPIGPYGGALLGGVALWEKVFFSLFLLPVDQDAELSAPLQRHVYLHAAMLHAMTTVD